MVSGINEGANTGVNVLVSGTVGAALQAHFWDVPAIAVSVQGTESWRFEPSARVALALARMFRDGQLGGSALLNVNLPNVPLDEVKGVAVTRLARGRYKETLQKADTPRPRLLLYRPRQGRMGRRGRHRHLGHPQRHGLTHGAPHRPLLGAGHPRPQRLRGGRLQRHEAALASVPVLPEK